MKKKLQSLTFLARQEKKLQSLTFLARHIGRNFRSYGMIRLTHDVIDYHQLTESVRRAGCGGVVLFLGTVRDVTGEQVTVALDYEAYPEMAEKKLAQIETETRERWPVGEMAIVHRLGRLEVSEISVAIAVACPHRSEAFEACRYAIDRLKQIVPIWKKENWSDGSTEWVDPTAGEITSQPKGS